jgi:hypothetical protein
MNNKSDPKSEKKPEAKEQDPVDQGKKAIEIQKRTSGKSQEEAEREEKEDEENWRNEG